jgi:KaiC/GvpD/RAD55 family RecA-like ATPase
MATETIIQVWSMPGIGKTWFALQLAASIASGKEFLRWKTTKDIDREPVQYPILYVEGEMRASSLRDRIVDIQQSMEGFNFNYFHIAPVAEQPNETFEPLNEERGRENIEVRLKEIFEQTGKKPFLFLDNISCLTSIQEKDGVEWISFMSWLVKLRARGYTVIFLHHSTKEGSTSSGSNMKERAVDIEIKLERQETKTLNGSKHKLSARTKKANKEIAEKKVIEQIKQNEGVEITIARTKEGTIYETKENN